ncbi:MAG: bifunctional precorrin-2 dehydrogenase/sirohydrochlorin ferrochelatase [Thermodesulfovibrionales bacterium]|nr:bifunctional precorrin-2 dehydrogenase/sirohydrochlorin ferrochelatase [Thermodesulfovibrionales bacterium]
MKRQALSVKDREALSVMSNELKAKNKDASRITHHVSRVTHHASGITPVYYPVSLNLKGKKTIVVGGGKVAERKVLSLLKSGAEVTVISPECTARLREKNLHGHIKYISRKYKKSDLKNAFLAIAATDSVETNMKISEDAPYLVNVVDMPLRCNFTVPSVVRQGPLTIAVSTSGVSPSIAMTIRKELEGLYGRGFSKHLNHIKQMRAKAIREIKDKKKRKKFLKDLAAEAWNKLRS